MLEKTERKVINQVISDCLARAMKFKRKAVAPGANKTDRIVARALALEFIWFYNWLANNLGPIGSSELAKAQKIEISDFICERGELYSSLSDSDELLDKFIEFAYQNDYIEGQRKRKELNRVKVGVAQVFKEQPEEVQKAITTLIKNGALKTSTPELIELNSKLTQEPKPRGNPYLGGLVRKYISQGLSKDEAFFKAKEELGLISATPEDIPIEYLSSAKQAITKADSLSQAQEAENLMNILSESLSPEAVFEPSRFQGLDDENLS